MSYVCGYFLPNCTAYADAYSCLSVSSNQIIISHNQNLQITLLNGSDTLSRNYKIRLSENTGSGLVLCYYEATLAPHEVKKVNATISGSITLAQYIAYKNKFSADYFNWYINENNAGYALLTCGQNFGGFVNNVPAMPVENPTISASLLCVNGVSQNRITIESPNTTNVTYFSVRKSTTISGTYTEVAKLYVSGGTFYYDDITGVKSYYIIYACNIPFINSFPSNIVEVNFNPVIEASAIWSDYPTLTFTAQTTNWCNDIDNVLWYLDGTLTGTTTGNTFTGLLPSSTVVYELTAKYIKDGVTGSTSNVVELIFFYTGTILSGFTSNGNMVIPNYFNRMEYLIVAGGGAGGYAYVVDDYGQDDVASGGGGAGGMLEGIINNPIAGTYPVVIGAGGINSPNPTNGNNSTFYGLTAIGGGKGGSVSSLVTHSGSNGGSGGGGSGTNAGNYGYPHSGGNGTVGQGNNGGAGTVSNGGGYTAGAGGGAGGAGTTGGAGGAGKLNDISGVAITYSRGGGTRTTQGGGTSAATNTGNGGGGAAAQNGSANYYYGGNGGSGIVYVYLYNYYPQVPVAPSSLAASLIDCDSLKLTWTNNDTTEVTGIHIQQNSGGTWVTIHDVAYTVNNYTVTGLTPLTNYQFRVVAYNELFNTASDSVYPTTLDATPYNVNGYAEALTAPFTWSINDTGYGTAIYPMIRVSGETAWITGATLANSATTYTFTGLSFNNDYEVQIVRTSIDGTYTSDIFEFSTADFIAPTLNGYLTDGDVTLEIFDNNLFKDYYEIYRDIGGTGFTLVDTIYYSATTWTDENIGSGVTYTYKVRSKLETDFTPVIYSDYSNEIDAKIFIILAASGLTASDIGYTGLTLTWVNNNTEGVTGNYVQQLIGGTWTTIGTVTSGTTTFDVTGLSPTTLYYFRIVAYNDVLSANSASAQATTLNPRPFNVTGTTITLFYQNIEWELPAEPFGDYIRVEYRLCTGGAWITYSTIAYDDTTETLSGLTMGECYEIRIVEHSNDFGDYPSTIYTLNIPAPNYPSAFCDGTNYSYSGSTCGNSGGSVTITVQEYLLYYDFVLTDIFGNTYSLVLDTFSGLPAGYYFLSATAKDEYKWYYGYDTCTISWIMVEDTDNPAYLINVSVRPLQCQPFDRQFGRIFYNVSGLTSGSTYSFYAFTSDLSLYYSKTGITSTEDFIIANASAQCYWVLIKDEVTNCILLLDNRCVPSINLFSQGGVKKLYIAKWNDDVDYNYWKDSDEDYFLEFTDTSFFTSTKIKEYKFITGATSGLTWYSIPVLPKVVSLAQKLEKVRQGYIFTDTLTVAVAKATAAKWLQMRNILNPEDKWIFIVQDADGFWWTGGYRHGARISVYQFKTGLRGEDEGYGFTFSAVSENKLLTSLDEDYIINFVE